MEGGASSSTDAPLVLAAAPPPPTDTIVAATTETAIVPAIVAIEVLPHKGHVVLNKPFDSDCTAVVHELTRETIFLPRGGDWLLEFDEAGFGAIADLEDLAERIMMCLLHR